MPILKSLSGNDVVVTIWLGLPTLPVRTTHSCVFCSNVSMATSSVDFRHTRVIISVGYMAVSCERTSCTAIEDARFNQDGENSILPTDSSHKGLACNGTDVFIMRPDTICDEECSPDIRY